MVQIKSTCPLRCCWKPLRSWDSRKSQTWWTSWCCPRNLNLRDRGGWHQSRQSRGGRALRQRWSWSWGGTSASCLEGPSPGEGRNNFRCCSHLYLGLLTHCFHVMRSDICQIKCAHMITNLGVELSQNAMHSAPPCIREVASQYWRFLRPVCFQRSPDDLVLNSLTS